MDSWVTAVCVNICVLTDNSNRTCGQLSDGCLCQHLCTDRQQQQNCGQLGDGCSWHKRASCLQIKDWHFVIKMLLREYSSALRYYAVSTGKSLQTIRGA